MKKHLPVVVFILVTLTACGGSNEDQQSTQGRGGGRAGMAGPGGGGGAPSAAVPVQVRAVERRSISQYLETNGTLEAENEVDIVARTSGPVTRILAEEGQMIRAGELMATIDKREAQNQVAISKVARDEARLAFDRAESSFGEGLVSREAHDTALSKLSAAEAQLEAAEIQLSYTEIRAPFGALVVTRDIKLAQFVTSGTTLFRISDFTPLLCRVELPEKDFSQIRIGQSAHIRVEAYPGEIFDASVARLRPTVDPATGTFTVTLEVDGRGLLRPGMFSSVYLETETREDATVIPREALVLDSLGDTVYLKVDGQARRREVRLGLRDEDSVEVTAGVAEGDLLVVVGQDGLADGTPIEVVGESPTEVRQASSEEAGAPSPEALEEMRQRMKARGLSDDEIEQRIRQVRAGGGPPGQRAGRGGGPGGMGQGDAGEIPPVMAQRIKEASPEELERIKERMQQFGMSDERIDEVVKKIRSEGGS